MKKILIVLAILFLNFAYSQENLIAKGFEAYDRGDYPTALEYFQKVCDLDEGVGCVVLGLMYENGYQCFHC